MHTIVLLNRKAGMRGTRTHAEHRAHDIATRVRVACDAHGLHADVRVVTSDEILPAAREACDSAPDAIVAAGGDGTVNAIAGEVSRRGLPLGVLPLGTLNHFARDLGLPLTLESAARIIAVGHVRQVDLGEVNGQRFINNAAIGLYPRVVLDRDSQRERLGRGKWLAMLIAIVKSMRRYPLVRVRIVADEAAIRRTTPFVFIGNNAYDVSLFTVRGRPRLDGGRLSLYTADRPGRFALVRMTLRALLGRLDQERDFDAALLEELWIETSKSRLHVAIDGEVTLMRPPLHFRTLPRSLRVFAPPVEVVPSPAPQAAIARQSP